MAPAGVGENTAGAGGGLEPIWQAVQLLMGNSYMTGASIKVDGGRALATL